RVETAQRRIPAQAPRIDESDQALGDVWRGPVGDSRSGDRRTSQGDKDHPLQGSGVGEVESPRTRVGSGRKPLPKGRRVAAVRAPGPGSQAVATLGTEPVRRSGRWWNRICFVAWASE